MTANEHDFGTYYEVEAVWDDEETLADGTNPERAAAFAAESETPLRWDDEARTELQEQGL